MTTLEQLVGSKTGHVPTLILCPAWGVTYGTLSQLQKGWHEGKDFKIIGGPYTSIRDIEKLLKDYPEVRIYKSCAKRDVNSCLIMAGNQDMKDFAHKPIKF